MPWQKVQAGAQSWTSAHASAQAWRAVAPVSSESRLNPIYPLPENPAGDLDYVYRVQSGGFFVVASGNGVQIRSRITVGV